jgi:hypothetical protein
MRHASAVCNSQQQTSSTSSPAVRKPGAKQRGDAGHCGALRTQCRVRLGQQSTCCAHSDARLPLCPQQLGRLQLPFYRLVLPGVQPAHKQQDLCCKVAELLHRVSVGDKAQSNHTSYMHVDMNKKHTSAANPASAPSAAAGTQRPWHGAAAKPCVLHVQRLPMQLVQHLDAAAPTAATAAAPALAPVSGTVRLGLCAKVLVNVTSTDSHLPHTSLPPASLCTLC